MIYTYSSKFVQRIASAAALSVFAFAAHAQDQHPNELVRTPAEAAQFMEFQPGTALQLLYGGVGTGMPTAFISRQDPAQAMAFPHTHSNGYRGFVLKGNYQHWELSEPDQGPTLTVGSSWYQPADVPHADLCVGPAACEVLIVFDAAADFIPAQ